MLEAADIRPHLTEHWVMSELGLEFDERPTEIRGLYIDPPKNAIVLSIDEKTGIQAKGLARPDSLPVPGRPPWRDNECVRHGTQDPFAALQVHSGEVTSMACKTRTRFDFLAFLERLEAEIPARQRVVAILDNLSAHKTAEVRDWLAAHKR